MLDQRTMDLIDASGDCWLWVGSTNRDGYSAVHRRIYSALVGPLPRGLELDHLCRVRNCVNPDHMEPVTHIENVRRGYSFSGTNGRKTHCERGHEFTPGNTYQRPRSGGRQCRTCQREAVYRYRAVVSQDPAA